MQHFLKTIGATNAELGDNWLTEPWGQLNNRLDLLDIIHFAKNRRPSGVNRDDRLVLYAVGWECIFGVAVVISDECYELITPGQERWPWALDVSVPLVVPRLSLAPALSEIEVAKTSVRQQSHIRLTSDQYELALAALTKRVLA